MPKSVRWVTDPNLVAWANMIRLLQRDAGATVLEVVQATGLNRNTVERYFGVLHQVGAAFICRWELDPRGAFTVRVLKLGQDDDAESKARPRALRARMQRDRERLNPKLREVREEKNRARANRHSQAGGEVRP